MREIKDKESITARIKELEEKGRIFHKIPNCDGVKAGLEWDECMELFNLKKEEAILAKQQILRSK